MSAAIARPQPRVHDPLRVRVVGLDELSFTPEGPARGHAHIGFAELPAGAPGRLEFPPLLLCAAGTVHPGEAFPMHRHENIENVLVVLRGCVEHEDSLGNRRELAADDVMVLSAGAGVEHSERVLGQHDVEALVLWLRPHRDGLAPAFFAAARPPGRDRWTVLASGSGAHGALPLQRDATILRCRLARGRGVTHELRADRRVYAIACGGELEAAGLSVRAGERLLAEGAGTLQLTARTDVEIVLVDMA